MDSPEDSSVSLRCVANGFPMPEIKWRREDGRAINIQSPDGSRGEVHPKQSYPPFPFLASLFLFRVTQHLLTLLLSPFTTATMVHGKYLNITKLQRLDSGPYICIAVSFITFHSNPPNDHLVSV